MEIFIQIWNYLSQSMTIIEMIATVFWLLSVYYTVKQNILCWPTGVVMVSLYIYIFYDVKLYSDAILQVIFLFLQFYGWYLWKFWGKQKDQLHIKTISNTWRILISVGIIAVSIGWWYFMSTKTDNALPYADSFVLYMSLVAQLFLSFKILESWVLWILVDILSLWLYYRKGLYVTFWLYFIFLILATLWLLEWMKNIKKQEV